MFDDLRPAAPPPSSGVMLANDTASPPPATTTVTLSLPALIQELKNHVPDDRKEALDRLVKQANDRPEEQAQIKQQSSTNLSNLA